MTKKHFERLAADLRVEWNRIKLVEQENMRDAANQAEGFMKAYSCIVDACFRANVRFNSHTFEAAVFGPLK